jgi:hypothetical protein
VLQSISSDSLLSEKIGKLMGFIFEPFLSVHFIEFKSSMAGQELFCCAASRLQKESVRDLKVSLP